MGVMPVPPAIIPVNDRCLSVHHGLHADLRQWSCQPIMQHIAWPWSSPCKMRTQVPLCIAGVLKAAPRTLEQQLVPYCQLIHVL